MTTISYLSWLLITIKISQQSISVIKSFKVSKIVIVFIIHVDQSRVISFPLKWRAGFCQAILKVEKEKIIYKQYILKYVLISYFLTFDMQTQTCCSATCCFWICLEMIQLCLYFVDVELYDDFVSAVMIDK